VGKQIGRRVPLDSGGFKSLSFDQNGQAEVQRQSQNVDVIRVAAANPPPGFRDRPRVELRRLLP